MNLFLTIKLRFVRNSSSMHKNTGSKTGTHLLRVCYSVLQDKGWTLAPTSVEFQNGSSAAVLVMQEPVYDCWFNLTAAYATSEYSVAPWVNVKLSKSSFFKVFVNVWQFSLSNLLTLLSATELSMDCLLCFRLQSCRLVVYIHSW